VQGVQWHEQREQDGVVEEGEPLRDQDAHDVLLNDLQEEEHAQEHGGGQQGGGLNEPLHELL